MIFPYALSSLIYQGFLKLLSRSHAKFFKRSFPFSRKVLISHISDLHDKNHCLHVFNPTYCNVLKCCFCISYRENVEILSNLSPFHAKKNEVFLEVFLG